MNDELRTTALTDRHVAAGAKLAPFAGWSMPLQFAGTLAEHTAVRSSSGIFDVSHLGTVWVEGEGALETIAESFTNDPGVLDDGGSQYTLCCDDDGGIIDDLIVYRLAADRWVAVPNAANTAAVVGVLDAAAADRGVSVRDESSDWAILAVQGPDALELTDEMVATLGGPTSAVSAIRYLRAAEVPIGGATAMVCRTGYTGEPGCEIVVPGAVAASVWDRAVASGAEPCGLGARDTLRLEMGYPLHGNELSTDTQPFEAGLGWAVKLDRGDFRGRVALAEAKQRGPSRRLRGLVADGRRPLRAGMAVTRSGADVGRLTSGGFSPTRQQGIGLGYLDVEVAVEDVVEVDVRGTAVPCEVVKPPFVDRDPRG